MGTKVVIQVVVDDKVVHEQSRDLDVPSGEKFSVVQSREGIEEELGFLVDAVSFIPEGDNDDDEIDENDDGGEENEDGDGEGENENGDDDELEQNEDGT